MHYHSRGVGVADAVVFARNHRLALQKFYRFRRYAQCVLVHFIQKFRSAEGGEAFVCVQNLFSALGHCHNRAVGVHYGLVKVAVLGNEQLSVCSVRYGRDCVKHAVYRQSLVAYLLEPCKYRFVAHFFGIDCVSADLFESHRFIARNRRWKGRYAAGNILCLLRYALAHRLYDLGYSVLGKLVERILRATDAVEYSHDVARATAQTSVVYPLARATYSPTAILVVNRKHGRIGVRLVKFGYEFFERRLDLFKFFKHNPFSFFRFEKNRLRRCVAAV